MPTLPPVCTLVRTEHDEHLIHHSEITHISQNRERDGRTSGWIRLHMTWCPDGILLEPDEARPLLQNYGVLDADGNLIGGMDANGRILPRPEQP